MSVDIDGSNGIMGVQRLTHNDIIEPTNGANNTGRIYKATGVIGGRWRPDSSGVAVDLGIVAGNLGIPDVIIAHGGIDLTDETDDIGTETITPTPGTYLFIAGLWRDKNGTTSEPNANDPGRGYALFSNNTQIGQRKDVRIRKNGTPSVSTREPITLFGTATVNGTDVIRVKGANDGNFDVSYIYAIEANVTVL